jgi:hypothetical protein
MISRPTMLAFEVKTSLGGLRFHRRQPQPLGPTPAGSDGGFETALLRLMPSFLPCTDEINRAVPAGRPLELELASFRRGVTFGFELGLEFRFGL